jgi:hypothetical protein
MKDGSAVFNFNGVYDGETGRYVFSAAKDGGSRSYNVFSKKDNAEGSYKERDSGSGEWTLRTGIPVTSFPGFIGEATVSAKPGLPETFWGKWASDPQAKVVKGETYYHSDGSPYTNTYEYFHNQVKDFSKSEDYPDTDDLEDMLNDDHGSDFERGKFRSTMLLSEWDMVHTGYIVDCEYSNDYNC